MNDQWREPTAEQQEQHNLARAEILEVVNRLIREGIDARVVLASLGSSSMDLITCTFGSHAVPGWFLTQHDITKALLNTGR
jgi:hypothetical protein